MSNSKEAFLASTKAAREARKMERQREMAVVLLQSSTRGWLTRLKLDREMKVELDKIISKTSNFNSLEFYTKLKNYVTFCHPQKVSETERLEKVARLLVQSLEEESPKKSYVGVALNKDHALAWISHMKTLLGLFSGRLSNSMQLESASGQRHLSAWLGALVAFTSTATWRLLKAPNMAKLETGMDRLCQNFLGHLVHSAGLLQALKGVLLNGLCGPTGKNILKRGALMAALTLAVRPVVAGNMSDNLLSLFLVQVLSVPGLVANVPDESLKALLVQNGLFSHCVTFLALEQQLKVHFNMLEGSYALCLTANLIDLVGSGLSETDMKQGSLLSDTVSVLMRLLDSCGQYVTAKQSNLSHWHPVLGWFSVSMDSHLQDSMPAVRTQLAKLWSPACLKLFTQCLLDTVAKLPDPPPPPEPHLVSPDAAMAPPLPGSSTSASGGNAAKQFIRKAMEKTKQLNSSTSSPQSRSGSGSFYQGKPATIKLGSTDCRRVALVCAMYSTAIRTLTQLQLDILAGLCHGHILLPPLWTLLQSLGPNCGQAAFMQCLVACPKATAPEFHLLTLFADCLSYLLTLLDDVEMYEDQKPFALGNYVTVSAVINSFLFHAIWNNLLVDTKSPLFVSLHSLLMVVYRRDNRRPFTRHNHWLIKEVKPSVIIGELDKGRRAAAILVQKLPHIIPHADRVVLFRRNISAEKASLGVSEHSDIRSTLVTIHRSRLVEDGFSQLSTLSPNALKGVIRVKFVNLQGLDEAGIDQDGVFKEFLEETIKKVFDPGLNLFCATSDERLYPSPTSHLTDNHLGLFEFVGQMIGKAVYEGIVIDIPFAQFFVSQILGKAHAGVAYYSYVDELPSLDSELYRQLTYVKHYKGDFSDLGLTFSFDQDVLGQIVTHELVPGGRGVAVSSGNRISYIHHIAQFRMHTQIRQQVAAFAKGFRSIIPPEWLSLFSPPEVIRLISGDNSPLDLKDLRKHTHYFGGFHDSHRVVNWLWDILEKDFDGRERAAFLKFVTSCSKPPLLGFQHLEPPFSIRCVEVGDDEDTGDTVGSVLRGFLALRGRKDPVNRLPTASTCFNLLKLPNYQKKSTLKEKLRYAVMSNTGFELS